MARIKVFLDVDVLTAAKQRIAHTFDVFDSVAVMFSGGKDSLAVLELARLEAMRRNRILDVVFRDEELIPDEVVGFVAGYRDKPGIRLHWFCVPLRSTKFVLGVTTPYIQWDPARPHIREMPEWSIRLRPGEAGLVLDQYTADAYIAERFRGKVAFMTGIRAAESLIRWRACVNKLNENYITASSTKRVNLVKPLYDWQENDIFRFFYDNEIRYCPIYDAQCWAGTSLRVATPCIAESAKTLPKIKLYAPVLYEQLLSVFPEMALQERYYGQLDRAAALAEYGQDLDGVERYIDDHIVDPAQHALARKRLHDVRVRARKQPQNYPAPHVLRAFVTGAYKREIQALPVETKP